MQVSDRVIITETNAALEKQAMQIVSEQVCAHLKRNFGVGLNITRVVGDDGTIVICWLLDFPENTQQFNTQNQQNRWLHA